MGNESRQLEGAVLGLVYFLAALIPVSVVIYTARLLPEFGLVIYKEQFLVFVLTLCLALTFLRKSAFKSSSSQTHVPWYDWILVLLALGAGGYVSFTYHKMVATMGLVSDDKVLVSVIGLVLLLEATRRLVGWTMVCVGLMALAYAQFGHLLSGMFETRQINWSRMVTYNFLGVGAVLGTPLYVAATIVTAFVLFGQMLFLTGGGDAISNFSFALMGKRRGGPAKVAVFSSALFGSLSGSASANVATTGMLTIPMMKRVGYSDAKSGAIEAVASTGGLVLPPVMAATGFLMAEFLGIPYASIALAAAIPALLFYFCVYLQVDLEAAKGNILPYDASQLPDMKTAGRQVIPVALAFGVLLYALFVLTQSPENSAFAATLATVVLSALFPAMRQNWKNYLKVLASAGEAVVFIAIMCAMAGLVVGVLGLTGLGSSLSQNLLQLAGGSVWLLLIFAAIGCIVLGMGVPVTATYIILIILVGPALVTAGISELSAHMFIFYFGTLSFLTPPVCLAVFVAASIAESNPWKTALYALRFAAMAYMIPFVFVFNDAFLMQGTAMEVVMAVFSGIAAVVFLSAGLVGYFFGPVHPVERWLALAMGIGIFIVASVMPLSFAGAWLLLGLWLLSRRQRNHSRLRQQQSLNVTL